MYTCTQLTRSLGTIHHTYIYVTHGKKKNHPSTKLQNNFRVLVFVHKIFQCDDNSNDDNNNDTYVCCVCACVDESQSHNETHKHIHTHTHTYI